MKLYFVRHAQSNGNAIRQAKRMGKPADHYDHSLNGNLTDDGMRQAEALAARLDCFHFDRIITSPLPRAMQTITPYLKRSGSKAEIWTELAEISFKRKVADHTEMPADIRYGNVIELDEEQSSLFTFRPHDQIRCTKPAKETYKEGLRRINRCKQLVLEQCKDETVLVVGHGNAGSRLLELLIGLEPDGRIEHDNTGISFLEQEEEEEELFLNVMYLNRL